MTTTGRKNTGSSNHDTGGWDHDALLDPLVRELRRIGAEEVTLSLDNPRETAVSDLVRVEIGLDFWHLPPSELEALLRDIPDAAGGEAIQQALEMQAMHVWRGPSPQAGRAISP